MYKKIIIIIIVGFVLCFPFIRDYVEFNSIVYFKELSLPSNWKISDLKTKFGEPKSIEEQYSGNIVIYRYETFSVLFFKNDYEYQLENARYNCVIIDNDICYFDGLGVGASKDTILKKYNDEKRIKDLKDNQVGFIINDTYWITYTFNSNDIVEEIRITPGA